MAEVNNTFESQEEVLKIIAESWTLVNKKQEERDGTAAEGGEGAGGFEPAKPVAKKEEKKSGGFFSRFTGGGKKADTAASSGGYEKEGNDSQQHAANSNKGNQFDVPETFDEMVKLNAAMTNANSTYITIMLDGFAGIVRDVCKYGQLQEQTDILAMRICKDVKGTIKTSEFKVCMLASMRSLIPGSWDTRHEQAWLWLWESIEVQLKESLVLPPKYEKPVDRWVGNLERDQRREICMNAWNRMFKQDAKAEMIFKQSNERLIFIAEKAIEFSNKIYVEPTAMNEAIKALGLKHIMFGAKPENFQLFCQMMEDELKDQQVDDIVISGLMWAMKVIACIMARVVEEGSTPIITAALANNAKEVKRVLAAQSRGVRSKCQLSAQLCEPVPDKKKDEDA